MLLWLAVLSVLLALALLWHETRPPERAAVGTVASIEYVARPLMETTYLVTLEDGRPYSVPWYAWPQEATVGSRVAIWRQKGRGQVRVLEGEPNA